MFCFWTKRSIFVSCNPRVSGYWCRDRDITLTCSGLDTHHWTPWDIIYGAIASYWDNEVQAPGQVRPQVNKMHYQIINVLQVDILISSGQEAVDSPPKQCCLEELDPDGWACWLTPGWPGSIWCNNVTSLTRTSQAGILGGQTQI